MMNIVCVICSDLLTPSDNVFITPCGHIFHFACLTQWLDRSVTCPQCREKTSPYRIHRVYFNFSNNDTITEDPSSLQERIDKLDFQNMLKDKEIKHLSDKCATLEHQTAGLRKEVRKVESELNVKDSTIYALKEQTKYLKTQCSDIQIAQQEIERLKKKIEEYRSVQVLLNASSEEVDEMISADCDPATLVTYISVMKREMTVSLNKRRELRNKTKSLQQELTKVSMERNFLLDEQAKRKKLEEDLMVCESEKMFIQNELRDLKKTMDMSEKMSRSQRKESGEGSSRCSRKSSPQKSVKPSDTNKNKVTQANAKEDTNDSVVMLSEDGENSPYLPVKSQGIYAIAHQTGKSLQSRTYSILNKKSRIERLNLSNKKSESNMLAYDGFGGHSRLDQFPSPLSPAAKRRKLRDTPIKPKKPLRDTSDNKKLDFLV